MKVLNNGLYETENHNYALFIQCKNNVDLIVYVSPKGDYLSHDTNWWWEPKNILLNVPINLGTFPKNISFQGNDVFFFKETFEGMVALELYKKKKGTWQQCFSYEYQKYSYYNNNHQYEVDYQAFLEELV